MWFNKSCSLNGNAFMAGWESLEVYFPISFGVRAEAHKDYNYECVIISNADNSSPHLSFRRMDSLFDDSETERMGAGVDTDGGADLIDGHTVDAVSFFP